MMPPIYVSEGAATHGSGLRVAYAAIKTRFARVP